MCEQSKAKTWSQRCQKRLKADYLQWNPNAKRVQKDGSITPADPFSFFSSTCTEILFPRWELLTETYILLSVISCHLRACAVQGAGWPSSFQLVCSVVWRAAEKSQASNSVEMRGRVSPVTLLFFEFVSRCLFVAVFVWVGRIHNRHTVLLSCTPPTPPRNSQTSIVVVALDYRVHAPLCSWRAETCLAELTQSSDNCFVQIGSETGWESWTSHRKLRQQVKTSQNLNEQRHWHRSVLYSFVKNKSLFSSFLSHNMASKRGPARNLAAWPWNKGSAAMPDYASEYSQGKLLRESLVQLDAIPWYVIPLVRRWQWRSMPQSGVGAWRRPCSFACPSMRGIPLRKEPGFDVGIPTWITGLK